MTKRKRPSNGPTDPGEESKRARPDSLRPAVKQSVGHGRVDATTGQRSAIPGLDDHDVGDGESEFDYGGEMEDALSYLRAVRAEANTIPNLLVAPQPERSIYDTGVGDSRGFYEDGAYTAAPSSPSLSADEVPNSTAQTKYYSSLLARFQNLREQLYNPPPDHAVELLDKDHPRVFRGDSKDWKAWRWRLANTEPWAVQLAGMDRLCLLRLLRMIAGAGGLLAGRGKGINGRTSRWLWGLLARLPEVGELGSEEVGVVREVGKKAVWVGVAMNGADVSALDGGDGDGLEVEEEESLDIVVEDAEAQRVDAIDEIDAEDLSDEPHELVIGPVQPSRMISSQPDSAIESLNQDQEDIPEVTSSERSRTLAPLQASTEDEEEGEIEDNADSLSATRSRILERLQASAKAEGAEGEEGYAEVNLEPEVHPKVPDGVADEDEDVPSNTRITVDMIITIVGELYGQRDLLAYRDVWE